MEAYFTGRQILARPDKKTVSCVSFVATVSFSTATLEFVPQKAREFESVILILSPVIKKKKWLGECAGRSRVHRDQEPPLKAAGEVPETGEPYYVSG
jgi:hypothetical protein